MFKYLSLVLSLGVFSAQAIDAVWAVDEGPAGLSLLGNAQKQLAENDFEAFKALGIGETFTTQLKGTKTQWTITDFQASFVYDCCNDGQEQDGGIPYTETQYYEYLDQFLKEDQQTFSVARITQEFDESKDAQEQTIKTPQYCLEFKAENQCYQHDTGYFPTAFHVIFFVKQIESQPQGWLSFLGW